MESLFFGNSSDNEVNGLLPVMYPRECLPVQCIYWYKGMHSPFVGVIFLVAHFFGEIYDDLTHHAPFFPPRTLIWIEYVPFMLKCLFGFPNAILQKLPNCWRSHTLVEVCAEFCSLSSAIMYVFLCLYCLPIERFLGTVAASIADIDFVKRREGIEEFFEDGTISFLSIASLHHGFKILNTLSMSAISRYAIFFAYPICYDIARDPFSIWSCKVPTLEHT